MPVIRRLCIRYRPPYNTRHTYATMMLMSGMKPAFCARQLGHDIKVFLETYSRWLDGDADALEMARLEATLGGILPQFFPRVRRHLVTARLSVERVMGIEPTLFAWEARVLPLNDTRSGAHSSLLQALNTPSEGFRFTFRRLKDMRM